MLLYYSTIHSQMDKPYIFLRTELRLMMSHYKCRIIIWQVGPWKFSPTLLSDAQQCFMTTAKYFYMADTLCTTTLTYPYVKEYKFCLTVEVEVE